MPAMVQQAGKIIVVHICHRNQLGNAGHAHDLPGGFIIIQLENDFIAKLEIRFHEQQVRN